jgi:hypothetical protein
VAFIPVTNTVQAEMRMTLFGQLIENTLYFRFGGVPVLAELGVLADDLIDWWDTEYSTVLSSELLLRECKVTSLVTASSPTITVAPASETRGKDDAPASPGNVALCVSFRTTSRGRSFRGRNYVPAIPTDQITGNTVASAIGIDLVGAYTDLLGRHALTDDGQWVIVSRFTGGAPRASGITTSVSSVAVVDNFVDSMRRRLTGRGL